MRPNYDGSAAWLVVAGILWCSALFAQSDPAWTPSEGADRLATRLQAEIDAGSLRACVDLGEMLLMGDGVTRDGPRGLTLLEKAARGGESAASLKIAVLLTDGELIAKDLERAMGYFRCAAASGEAEAYHSIGKAYVEGRGVKRDYVEALGWLLLARKHGDDSGADQQVRSHIEKRRPDWVASGVARSAAIETELKSGPAVSFLPAVADLVYSGPTTSESEGSVLGPIYDVSELQGSGQRPQLDQNAPQAPRFVLPETKAPTGSVVKVVLATGRIQRWADMDALKRAADEGDAVALAAHGQVLLEGKGVEADGELAVIVLERAAAAGSPDAAHLLAEIYRKGTLVIEDAKKSFEYSLQAARGGALVSIYNVGGCYANGRGTTRDLTQALAWLLVAKHYQLDPGDEQRIRQFLTRKSPAEIPVAERRAAELVREIDADRKKLTG
jgi:TPR repeat protein